MRGNKCAVHGNKHLEVFCPRHTGLRTFAVRLKRPRSKEILVVSVAAHGVTSAIREAFNTPVPIWGGILGKTPREDGYNLEGIDLASKRDQVIDIDWNEE